MFGFLFKLLGLTPENEKSNRNSNDPCELEGNYSWHPEYGTVWHEPKSYKAKNRNADLNDDFRNMTS